MRISLARIRCLATMRGADFVGSGGKLVDAHARRVIKRIQNRGRCGNQGLFANSFGAERADGRRVFDENRFDRWHVANCGNQVIVEIFTFAREETPP